MTVRVWDMPPRPSARDKESKRGPLKAAGGAMRPLPDRRSDGPRRMRKGGVGSRERPKSRGGAASVYRTRRQGNPSGSLTGKFLPVKLPGEHPCKEGTRKGMEAVVGEAVHAVERQGGVRRVERHQEKGPGPVPHGEGGGHAHVDPASTGSVLVGSSLQGIFMKSPTGG